MKLRIIKKAGNQYWYLQSRKHWWNVPYIEGWFNSQKEAEAGLGEKLVILRAVHDGSWVSVSEQPSK